MMNKWIENTLLPLVCAFGLGVVIALDAAERAYASQIDDAARTLATTRQYSECPPYGYPVTEPAPKFVAARQ